MGTPLKNPPVFFTLVQARFNALLKIGDYVPAIQEALRKAGFPDFTSRQVMTLQLGNQGDPAANGPVIGNLTQYVFGNSEKTHMFLLNPDALTLQSTHYGRFEAFSAQFLKGLTLVHEIMQLDFTDRVGLRYLDRIMPLPGDALGLYLVPEVRGITTPMNGQVMHSFSETFGRVEDVQMRSRVLIQTGPLAFPPDLPSDGMQVEDRFVSYSGHHATLDNDGFIEKRTPFSAQQVGEQVHSIHRVISAAFKATITDYARQVWDEV